MFSVQCGSQRFSFAYIYLGVMECALDKERVILHVGNYKVEIDGLARRLLIQEWNAAEAARSGSQGPKEEDARSKRLGLAVVEKKKPQALLDLIEAFEVHAVVSLREGDGVRLKVVPPKKKKGEDGEGGDEDEDDDGLGALREANGENDAYPEPPSEPASD